jgi:hypothetical protein
LDGFLTARDTIELDVYLALTVWVNRDVDNLSIFVLAFGLDILLKILNPILTGFPAGELANGAAKGLRVLTLQGRTYSSKLHIC